MTFHCRYKLVTVPIGEQPLFKLAGPDDAPSTIPISATEPSDAAQEKKTGKMCIDEW